jgi:hypothetical protein
MGGGHAIDRKRRRLAGFWRWNMSYAWEKFYVAVLGLAEGSEPIQRRVAYAFTGSLVILAAMNPSPIPTELQPQFRAIYDRVRRDGPLLETTAAMSDEEAAQIAREIVGIFGQLKNGGQVGDD